MSISKHTVISLIFILVISANLYAQDEGWREPDPENLAYMELTDGTVIIELNPMFAPKTVEQFKKLTREGFYHGLSFYRVIDGFVAQGGDGSDISEQQPHPSLPAEFEIEWEGDTSFFTVQKNDLFAYETGFIDGFAAARDEQGETAWLTHCPGVVAMARGNEADSGSTDFYIVIGQAPRYLDRNLTIFGRVLHGMDKVQRIIRGPSDQNGIIEDEVQRSRIKTMKIAADLEEDQRKGIYVTNTNSSGFAEAVEGRRNRSHEFFHHKPPKVLDVCQVPVAVRVDGA